MIPEHMYNEIVKERGWKLSSTIREALEDSLNMHKITLSVSSDTKELYQHIFNYSDACDTDIEPFLRKALKEFIDAYMSKKFAALNELKERLKN